MWNNKHDQILSLKRELRLVKLEAERHRDRLFTSNEASIARAALAYVETKVRDKAGAAKVRNGAELGDVQQLFSLADAFLAVQLNVNSNGLGYTDTRVSVSEVLDGLAD